MSLETFQTDGSRLVLKSVSLDPLTPRAGHGSRFAFRFSNDTRREIKSEIIPANPRVTLRRVYILLNCIGSTFSAALFFHSRFGVSA